MCVDVYNTDTKEWADNVKQFANMIGIDDCANLPLAEHYKMIFPEGCLCQIDVEKACEMAGVSVELSKDFDKYFISKKSNYSFKSLE